MTERPTCLRCLDTGTRLTPTGLVPCEHCPYLAGLERDREHARAASTAAPPETSQEQGHRIAEAALAETFADRLDFFGGLVHPGRYHHRAFSLAFDCRVRGIRLPRGLVAVRIALRTGSRFRTDAADSSTKPASFSGEDALVFDRHGDPAVKPKTPDHAIAVGRWKDVRLVAESGAAVHLVVRNDSQDDLLAEGSLMLEEAPVPRPEHEEV